MDSGKQTGIGFCGLLAIVFIVLKLCGVIAWSWVWVLAPIWIPIAFSVIILVIIWILCFKDSKNMRR